MEDILFQLSTSKPRDYTEKDKKLVVDWLSKLPLSELRKRQDLIVQQQEMAYKQDDRNVMDDLEVMWDCERLAVDKKCFD